MWEDPGIHGEMSIRPRLPVHHGKTPRLVSLQGATFSKHFVAILTYELLLRIGILFHWPRISLIFSWAFSSVIWLFISNVARLVI